MVNQAHLNMWLADLETTDAPQVQSQLADRVGDMIGNCCLGRGCIVAGIPMEEDFLRYEDDEEQDQEVFYFDGATDLPPPKFLKWLGLGSNSEDDVHLDWPSGQDGYAFRDNDKWPEMSGQPCMRWTCAQLNDICRLTFPQIADMVRYFGIDESRYGTVRHGWTVTHG